MWDYENIVHILPLSRDGHFLLFLKFLVDFGTPKARFNLKRKKDCQNLTNLRAVIIIKQRGH